ncbi:MAG TPA: 30S ribosomal protein S8 [Candidatus Saccharibacteria bacterium]|jgi:small subunit ribosomal protein S8|nr:30S ribosomal protein S8 [Candidatus Saccharibacteria bacterium]HMT55861.1 30S ribosomal protein S8 [Candidatus Saccharibacteria bacterium]
MVSTDPIADMLTRIRNALAVRQEEVRMPHSKIKQSVAEILVENKYIASSAVEGEGIEKALVIQITGSNAQSPITEIKRVSKPGRRVYAKVKDIPTVKQGRGLVIVSTSKGVMTGNAAREQKLGGEVLCQVY